MNLPDFSNPSRSLITVDNNTHVPVHDIQILSFSSDFLYSLYCLNCKVKLMVSASFWLIQSYTIL